MLPIQTSTTTTLISCSASALGTLTAVPVGLLLQEDLGLHSVCKCWSFNGSPDLLPLILQELNKDLQQPSVARTSVLYTTRKINEW